MTERVTILCLARSYKHHGACIAGKIIGHDGVVGRWIRPISMRPGHEISSLEERLDSNNVTKLLDVVTIPVQRHGNGCFQEENQFMAAGLWGFLREASFYEAFGARDNPPTLWENGDHTYNGINDCVHESYLACARPSLYLIQPLDPVFHVSRSCFNGSKEVRLSFVYNGDRYKLKVSDMIAKIGLVSKECGDYPLEGRSLLCISLTEVFAGQGKAYKVVAGVMN